MSMPCEIRFEGTNLSVGWVSSFTEVSQFIEDCNSTLFEGANRELKLTELYNCVNELIEVQG